MKNSTEKELLLLLHTKVDSINDKVCEVEKVQVLQEANLFEHMRRTSIAEERIELMETEVKPILQGISFLKVIAKYGSAIVSFVYAALKFFH